MSVSEHILNLPDTIDILSCAYGLNAISKLCGKYIVIIIIVPIITMNTLNLGRELHFRKTVLGEWKIIRQLP